MKDSEIEVQFEDVDFGYREDEWILNGVSMNFKPYTITAIIGESGCGKSTIAKLLFGLWKVNYGSIKLNGIPLNSLSVTSLRKKITVITQDVVLLNDTLKNNIDLAQKFDNTVIQNVCEIVQLKELICELPNGLNESIGEHGSKLSGGQKQRIAVARALLEESSVIILDEITAALDNITQENLMKAIEPILRRKTVIIITHRLSTIKNADYVYVLDNQTVVEEGTPDYLSKSGKKYLQFQKQDQ